MSKRKRTSHRVRPRQKPVQRAHPTSSPQSAARPGKAVSTAARQASTDSTPQPRYEWVQVEHRDGDGNPTLPRGLIASTYRRRYEEVPSDAKIEVHVRAGHKPKPLLMVERKIYEIHRLSVRGWRRSGQLAVEVEDWRYHEADWFKAMRGARLEISDPGLPGPHNEESKYVILKSSFERKIVKSLDERGNDTEVRLHEGTLDIRETWKSVWRRQSVEVLSTGFKLLLLPLFAALGSGLTLLWLGQSPWAGGASDSPEAPAQHADQLADGGQGDDPSKDETVDQEARGPVRELVDAGDRTR